MSDITYRHFVKRWQEVTDLPTQTVGPLTPLYKFVASRLKTMPWFALIVISVCGVGLLYVLIGSTITLLTSILQRGF